MFCPPRQRLEVEEAGGGATESFLPKFVHKLALNRTEAIQAGTVEYWLNIVSVHALRVAVTPTNAYLSPRNQTRHALAVRKTESRQTAPNIDGLSRKW